MAITIPALRERDNDVVMLGNYYAEATSKRYGLPFDGFSKSAIRQIKEYSWYGNVRELKAKVDAAKTVKQDEPIDWEDIPETAISILYESDAISLPNLPLPLPLKSHKDYDYNDAIIDKARNLAENDEEVDRLLGQGGQRIEANRKQRKKLKK